MKPHLPQPISRISMASQVAAVLVVLLAVFALPCCPRVDGLFSTAAAAAEEQVFTTTASHAHHHGATVDNGNQDAHKGHLLATGVVDVLPFQGLVTLLALLPLLVLSLSRLPHPGAAASPRIPVPPPRIAVA